MVVAMNSTQLPGSLITDYCRVSARLNCQEGPNTSKACCCLLLARTGQEGLKRKEEGLKTRAEGLKKRVEGLK